MSNKQIHTNGNISSQQIKDPNELLPGTTFPQDHSSDAEAWYTTLSPEEPPSSFPGPELNGRPTSVAIYKPRQFISSPILPPLYETVNAAFRHGHSLHKVTLVNLDRLRYENQFLDELGNKEGTFTWIIQFNDTKEVAATATIKRFLGHEAIVDKDYYSKNVGNTWTRLGSVPADTAAWELTTMAVQPELMGQGIAGYLMKTAQDEIKQLFKAEVEKARSSGGPQLSKLLIVITTLAERNEEFYKKRGFTQDYRTKHEPGHLGSVSGFSVVHMSKVIELGDL